MSMSATTAARSSSRSTAAKTHSGLLAETRADLLLRVGHEANKIDESSLIKSLSRWYKLFPQELRLGFAPAAEFLDSLPFDEILQRFAQIKDVKLPLSDFLASRLLAEESSDSIKKRGAVFTPAWLAERVARETLGHWRRLHRSGRQPKTVADLSCGCGAFMLASQSVFPSTSRLIGADTDKTALLYTMLIRFAFGFSWELRHQDSLFSGPHTADLLSNIDNELLQNNFDILIGNPPYVRSPSLEQDYSRRVRQYYPSTSSGNYDLSIAFIEHAIQTLSPDGIAAYVLSNKFMTTNYGKDICRMLATKTRILNIHDFQDYQIFPGYTTYTCVVTFSNKSPSKRFSITRFPQGISLGEDPGKGETATLPTERLLEHPWDFAGGTTHDVLRLLRDPKHPLLTSVFSGIQQGIRTGANDIFITQATSRKGLDKDVQLPFVGGEQIRTCSLDKTSLSLIFPYHSSGPNRGAPLQEAELQSKFQRTYRYLLKFKTKLTERSLDSSIPWWAYSRSQNLLFFQKPKILVREMMPRASFAADLTGGVAFCSGYGLDASHMNQATLRMWTAVLCTPTMEYVLRHNGTQLHSGWFRLMKHHLARTRLPYLTKVQISKASQLAQLLHKNPKNQETLRSLDSLVADAFGLTKTHRNAIQQYLSDCHKRSISANDVEDAQSGAIPNPKADSHSATSRYEPVRLTKYDRLHRDRPDLAQLVTFKPNKRVGVYNWYQFTQGFSADLVQALVTELNVDQSDIVFDPFVGSGTTLLACRQLGIDSMGTEISPLMTWVSECKVTPWRLPEIDEAISNLKKPRLQSNAHKVFSSGIFADYFAKAYSPFILGQLVAIATWVNASNYTSRQKRFLLLGLIGIMEEVSQIRKHGSHYRYMLNDANIGLQKLNIQVISPDSDIWPIYLNRLKVMRQDVQGFRFHLPIASCKVFERDAKQTGLAANSVTAVITSPPYLNRNNYIAQQKAELAILRMVTTKNDFKKLVRSTFRSHTDSALDPEPISRYRDVRKILEAIQLTEQNNAKIPHMIAGYFEDMGDTVAELYRILKPGGICAFVVGNTRWGGVVVPVDHLLLQIAEDCGFVGERVLVTRLKGNSPQQMRAYGRIPVRESIVVFRKPR